MYSFMCIYVHILIAYRFFTLPISSSQPEYWTNSSKSSFVSFVWCFMWQDTMASSGGRQKSKRSWPKWPS
jgi:hypothetical protein